MNRLVAGLGLTGALLGVAAVVLFALGGTGGVVGGVVAAALALVLLLAFFGLMRDPQARELVADRVAAARGEERASAAALAATSQRGPVEIEAEPSQGFSVGGRRAPQDYQRKAKSGQQRSQRS